MAADITAMGQGAETLRITATDAAGNTAQGTRDITVDTMAPVFTAGDTDTINVAVNTVAAYDATATDHPSITKDEGITYSLSSTDSMTFDIDGANGMVTYTTAPTVAGTYTITITATDTAGNTATQIVTISVVTAPVITITTDVTTATGIANLASGKVTFTFDFPRGGHRVCGNRHHRDGWQERHVHRNRWRHNLYVSGNPGCQYQWWHDQRDGGGGRGRQPS